ncbi:TonB-dependent receptor [Poseidonibacter antarcticus]|uniref:TonB-dependent receptor n=1 Tax=Poseidonibacter antarcticus TaxID=2478538 RepID=UPI000EF5201F|nr:TonB-dependent receptor [Poseidonibacter antarcticus]
MKIKNLTLSACTSFILLSSLAYAEDITLDSITVTSDFRDKNLSQTSNAISVLSEDKIEEKAHQSFENVIGQIPNVNFSTGGSRAHYIQIRGIGERSQFISPVNPSVGLVLDGIDVSESALALTMFDVNQIEVLKGPQGTTFGSNGMAGVVSLQSNQPTKDFEGHIETTVGNYNTKSIGLALGGTLIEDTLLGRFSVYKNTSDGFMENKYLGKKDTQNIDELALKGQLTYLASDEHTVDINLAHIDVDNGYDAWTFDNSYNTYSDQPGTDAQETNAIAIKSTYQINRKMHLISKASFSKSDSTYSYDEDWSYKGAFADSLYPYSSFDEYLRKREKVDIDLRLVSDEDGRILNNTTDWTFGTYYKNQSEDLTRNYTYLSSPYTSSYDTENLAIYGQLDSHIADKLTLTTGLRVEKWEAKYSDSDSLNIDTDEVLVGGKVGLNYQENENDLYYVTLSKGYKPGGVNADNSLSSNAREFNTEHLWNLDIGKSFSNLDNKLKSRINFFYGLRRDQQVKSSTVTVRTDGSTEFTDYLANAAKSSYYGVEAQTDYYADNTLHLFASLGLLKSKFDEYEDPNPSNVDVNGRTPAQSPVYQYNVGFDYMLTNDVQFKTDVEGKDSYYFSNRHNAKSKSYALLNASVSYFASDWTLTLWGKNLTDKSYQTRGFGSFGNNPGNGYATELYTQEGDPRTFGFTAKYYF